MLVNKYGIHKFHRTTCTSCLGISEHGEFLKEIPFKKQGLKKHIVKNLLIHDTQVTYI